MNSVLITLHDGCHPLPYTEAMIDEWFRSLSPAEKVRLFWMEHEAVPSDLGTFVDASLASRSTLNPVAEFVARIDATERRFAEAYGGGVPHARRLAAPAAVDASPLQTVYA